MVTGPAASPRLGNGAITVLSELWKREESWRANQRKQTSLTDIYPNIHQCEPFTTPLPPPLGFALVDLRKNIEKRVQHAIFAARRLDVPAFGIQFPEFALVDAEKPFF